MAAIKTHTRIENIWNAQQQQQAAYIILLCAERPIMAERAAHHVFCSAAAWVVRWMSRTEFLSNTSLARANYPPKSNASSCCDGT